MFKLKMNPFSGECILEQDALDIYVFASSYDEAVRQVESEVGYIWDEYILNQKSIDTPFENDRNAVIGARGVFRRCRVMDLGVDRRIDSIINETKN